MDRVAKSRSVKKNTRDRAVRLDGAVQKLVCEQLLPRQNTFDSIDALWRQLLPSDIIHHCKIDNISGGILKVKVDSPLYIHELRLCGAELLAELQRRCPRARIKKIKFTLT